MNPLNSAGRHYPGRYYHIDKPGEKTIRMENYEITVPVNGESVLKPGEIEAIIWSELNEGPPEWRAAEELWDAGVRSDDLSLAALGGASILGDDISDRAPKF